MLTQDEKSIAIRQFNEAKELSAQRKTSILEKIKNIKSLSDLMIKIHQKVIKNASFAINNKIASIIYGKKIMPYHSFQIDIEDAEKLLNHLNSSKNLKRTGTKTKGKRSEQQKSDEFNELSLKMFNETNLYQTWFEIKRHIIFDELINKIKPNLSEYLKSPFSVVNLNAWKAEAQMKAHYDPDGNARGQNRIHQDGYPPGHYKCIIYLNPLNDEFGKLQIEDKIIESEQPGFAVIFNNNLYHQSIPGKSGDKYLLELTLMRTIIKVDMLKHYPGAPDSLYLEQAYQAYI